MVGGGVAISAAPERHRAINEHAGGGAGPRGSGLQRDSAISDWASFAATARPLRGGAGVAHVASC